MTLADTTDTSRERLYGALLILLAATLWSSGGVFIKKISLDAFQTSAWRSFFAALAMLVILRPKKISFDGASLTAAIAYALTLMLFVAATKLTSSANAILLQYTAPIYILVLSLLWFKESVVKEPVDKFQLLTVAACFLGMGIFFLDELSIDGLLGNLFALLSGVTLAAMTLAIRKAEHADPVKAIILGNFFVVMIGGSAAFITHDFSAQAFHITPADALMVGFLGIFQIGIPYILFVRGLRSVYALDASLLAMIEAVLNPVWVFFFIGEAPSRNALIGGGIIIGAVVLQNVLAAKRVQDPKQSV
jgi:drug/metabolite transporter, DME family